MLRKHYDVVIIGAGPAGLFAAHELKELHHIRVLVVDRGAPPDLRICPLYDSSSPACSCKVCGRVQGGGGAGLFSDGKLVLDLQSGGHLREYSLPYPEHDLLSTIENTLYYYDGYSVDLNPGLDDITAWNKQFTANNLSLKTYPVRHFGSYNLRNIMTTFIKSLREYVDFSFWSDVTDIQIDADNRKVLVVNTKDGQITINTNTLVFAVGKFGAQWLNRMLTNLGVTFDRNRTYLGVRIETPSSTLSELFKLSFDPKIYHIFDDGSKIKTHCFCRNGEIVTVRFEGLPQVGGHTPYTEKNLRGGHQAQNRKSNFAVLLGDTEGLRFSKEQIDRWLIQLNEVTQGKILVQRMGDFLKSQPSSIQSLNQNSLEVDLKHFSPGNLLDFDLPLEFKQKFLWFMERLNRVVPGLLDPDNLIYAPAMEWCMDRVPVDINMQTALPGVFAIGDGAGLSQGIVHAAATGILAGRSIRSQYSKERTVITV